MQGGQGGSPPCILQSAGGRSKTRRAAPRAPLRLVQTCARSRAPPARDFPAAWTTRTRCGTVLAHAGSAAPRRVNRASSLGTVTMRMKPSAALPVEPALELVRHRGRRAGERRAVHAVDVLDGLAQGERALPGDLHDVLGLRAEALLRYAVDVGERRVEVVLREVVPAERATQLCQTLGEVLRARRLLDLIPGLLVGVGEANAQRREDQDLVGIAALRGGPLLHLAVERLRTPRTSARCVKMPSPIVAPRSRPSSESPAWKITGWPCGERSMLSGPTTEKCSPRWLSACWRVRSKKTLALPVARERVVLVGVPQPARDA